MPDNAALPISLFITFADRLHDLFDGKVLLITADFLHIAVKQNEVTEQFHHAGNAEQRDDVPILLGGYTVGNQPIHFALQESCILLFPHVPELLRRAGSGVLDAVLVGRHYDLRKHKQLRNILHLLIAHHLLNGLLHRNMGGFALDHSKRNAVDKQHNIRTSGMLLVLTVNGVFICDMEHIVLRVLPVDILQVKTEQLPFSNGFLIAAAQQQRIVNPLACAHQPLGQSELQVIHGALNIGGGEFIYRAAIFIAIEFAQLPPQHVAQQHPVGTAALQHAVVGGNVAVAHGLQELYGGLLAGVFFEVDVGIHMLAAPHLMYPYSSVYRSKFL